MGNDMKTLAEPSQLIIGMSHKEMLDVMKSADIFCSVDKFCRILQDAQRRALETKITEGEEAE
jgi:hypothetical protein